MKRAFILIMAIVSLLMGCSYRFRAQAGRQPDASIEVSAGSQSVEVDTDGRIRINGKISP
jgi:alkylated DNA repair dioxygenase AlkB